MDKTQQIPADWLTVQEAADAAPGGAMTAANMTYLLRLSKIRGMKRGGRWWVDPVSLAAYVPGRSSRERVGVRA